MKRYFEGDSLDEIWIQICCELYDQGQLVQPRGQVIKEIRHLSFELKNPRNRIIFHPVRAFSIFYAFGELFWYLSKSNDLAFIEFYNRRMKNYSDDGRTLNSAYGLRIFSNAHSLIPFNQWEHVIDQLQGDRDTRQAIIHIHTPNNKPTKDEVCTLSLQFFIREDKLELAVTMRSNDIYWGMGYDVFAFTCMQEYMANRLNIEMGSYYHYAGSMHLYENHFPAVNILRSRKKDYSVYPMDKFDLNDSSITTLLDIESYVRLSKEFNYTKWKEYLRGNCLSFPQNLKDVVNILAFHKFYRLDQIGDYSKLLNEIPLKSIYYTFLNNMLVHNRRH